MRGVNTCQSTMFSFTSPEQRIPKGHPLRRIKVMADAELKRMSPIFSRMYSKMGRPSIAPERLLKSLLLISLYTIRSERMFCEQLEYNLLFRWFLDMNIDDPAFDASTFSQNRDRLLEHDVGQRFFESVVRQASDRGLASDEHFTVDGTLIEAWASLKSFRPKGEDQGNRPPPDDSGNPTVNFRGEKRSNATHESTTDPESRLMRKSTGKEAKLSYGGHALMENRHGLLVDIKITEATGTSEREAGQLMLKRQRKKVSQNKHFTLGADKGYDTADFVKMVCQENTTPHIACNTGRRGGSAIDGRTTRHIGYVISQRIRKRVEEIFGWMKTIGGLIRTRYKGRRRTQLAAYFVGAAYNLLRMSRLVEVEV